MREAAQFHLQSREEKQFEIPKNANGSTQVLVDAV